MKNVFYFLLIIFIVSTPLINSQSRHTRPQTPIRTPRSNPNEETKVETRIQDPVKIRNQSPVKTKGRENTRTEVIEREEPSPEVFEEAPEMVQETAFIEVKEMDIRFCGGSDFYNTEESAEPISEIEFYNNAIEKFPEDTVLYFLRGVVKNKLEDYSGAIEDFSIYLTAFPKDEEAYYQRGLAYLFNLDRNNAFLDFQFSYYLGSEESENILKKYF